MDDLGGKNPLFSETSMCILAIQTGIGRSIQLLSLLQEIGEPQGPQKQMAGSSESKPPPKKIDLSDEKKSRSPQKMLGLVSESFSKCQKTFRSRQLFAQIDGL